MYLPSGEITAPVTGTSGGLAVMRCSVARGGDVLVRRHATNTPNATSTSTHTASTQCQLRFFDCFSLSASGFGSPVASVKVAALASPLSKTGASLAKAGIGGVESPINGGGFVVIGPSAAAMFATGAINLYPLFDRVSM